MNPYHTEQREALDMIRAHLESLSPEKRRDLEAACEDYLEFRQKVALFLNRHFDGLCTRRCYLSRRSACCSREGIVTFFADVVINLLQSTPEQAARLAAVLQRENTGYKCVYLSPEGCLWQVKPIVCQMFLCESAQKSVFADSPHIESAWRRLCERRKRFTWPDRPVLFDILEKRFMEAGCRSSLMYFHQSPGLLSVKKRAGYDP